MPGASSGCAQRGALRAPQNCILQTTNAFPRLTANSAETQKAPTRHEILGMLVGDASLIEEPMDFTGNAGRIDNVAIVVSVMTGVTDKLIRATMQPEVANHNFVTTAVLNNSSCSMRRLQMCQLACPR
jgi:hypothetical protein